LQAKPIETFRIFAHSSISPIKNSSGKVKSNCQSLPNDYAMDGNSKQLRAIDGSSRQVSEMQNKRMRKLFTCAGRYSADQY